MAEIKAIAAYLNTVENRATESHPRRSREMATNFDDLVKQTQEAMEASPKPARTP